MMSMHDPDKALEEFNYFVKQMRKLIRSKKYELTTFRVENDFMRYPVDNYQEELRSTGIHTITAIFEPRKGCFK